MIKIEELKALANNDGMTLVNGKAVTYKTGYQVATEGKEATTAEEALKLIEAYNGDCGIWCSEGIYYIDKSRRVNTLKEALRIGRECNQQSILKWADMSLVWCN